MIKLIFLAFSIASAQEFTPGNSCTPAMVFNAYGQCTDMSSVLSINSYSPDSKFFTSTASFVSGGVRAAAQFHLYSGDYVPAIIVGRSSGTSATPLPVKSGMVLGSFGSVGYNGVDFDTLSSAVNFQAEQDFSDTERRSAIRFFTAPAGTGQVTSKMRLSSLGNLRLGDDAEATERFEVVGNVSISSALAVLNSSITASAFFGDGSHLTGVSGGSGISELTGDVTAGPGSGAQIATIAAGVVDTGKLATDAITAAKIITGAVETTKLAADSVLAAKIISAAVETSKLAADAVTSAKIMTSAVETTKIASDAITSASILTGVVSVTKLAAGAVETSKLGTDAVTTIKIIGGAVETSKIAVDAVTSAKIVSSAIQTTKIAVDAVVTAAILNGAITLPKVGANGCSANQVMKRNAGNTAWACAADDGAAIVSTSTVIRPLAPSSGSSAVANASLTVRKVGAFYLPHSITLNKIGFTVGAVTTAGTYKICIYSENKGTKLVDVTSGAPAVGNNTVAVGAVSLSAGTYWAAIGCATTCNNTVSGWTTISIAGLNANTIPTGNSSTEGTVTHASGTCDTTLGVITPAISHLPVLRLYQ